jgi:hypothetical protein
MNRFSINNIPAPTIQIQPPAAPVEAPEIIESKQVNLLTNNDFQELKDKMQGSKSEIVMVGIRMTAAERKSLRSMSAQTDVSIQDIVREGVALWRAKRGLR